MTDNVAGIFQYFTESDDTMEDTFDVIKRAHIATGHGGRDRMMKELQRKYANITVKSWNCSSLYVRNARRRKIGPD